MTETIQMENNTLNINFNYLHVDLHRTSDKEIHFVESIERKKRCVCAGIAMQLIIMQKSLENATKNLY